MLPAPMRIRYARHLPVSESPCRGVLRITHHESKDSGVMTVSDTRRLESASESDIFLPFDTDKIALLYR